MLQKFGKFADGYYFGVVKGFRVKFYLAIASGEKWRCRAKGDVDAMPIFRNIQNRLYVTFPVSDGKKPATGIRLPSAHLDKVRWGFLFVDGHYPLGLKKFTKT